MRLKKIILFILILVWMCIIFNFSAQDSNESLNTSNEVIIKTAEVIKKEKLTEPEKKSLIKKFIVPVRKSAHFFLYFVLGILVFLFVSEYIRTQKKTILLTVIACFIYACTDEIHQLFSDGRTARILDVIIDTSGAFISSIICYFTYYIYKRIKKTN